MSTNAEPELTIWDFEEGTPLSLLEQHNRIVAKLKAELAESIPKARVQKLIMKIRTKSGHNYQINSFRNDLNELLSSGKENP